MSFLGEYLTSKVALKIKKAYYKSMTQTPFKEASATLNGLLLIAIVVLSITNFKRGNKRRSWASAFHVLCIVWLCFRQVFWYLTLVTYTSWSATEFYLVYWFPHPIQVS